MEWAPRKTELDRLHRGARVRRVRSLLGRWMLDLFRSPRGAEPAPMPAVGPGQLAVVFGGHASVLLRTSGLTIAFDPMLGQWAGGSHRAVASALTPAHLASVGLVLISHGHHDHLHLPSLEPVPRSATVIVPSGVAQAVSALGFARVVELGPGAALTTDGVTVTACALDHGGDPMARALGYLVQGDGPSAFLCGDGGYGPEFAQLGARVQPDVAFLPIGGFLPWSFRRRHLSPLDALYAFEDLGARLLIPIHHGAFTLSYERLDEPERWLRELVEQRGLSAHVRFLPVGGTEVFTSPEAAARMAAEAAAAVAPAPPVAAEVPGATSTPPLIPGPSPSSRPSPAPAARGAGGTRPPPATAPSATPVAPGPAATAAAAAAASAASPSRAATSPFAPAPSSAGIPVPDPSLLVPPAPPTSPGARPTATAAAAAPPPDDADHPASEFADEDTVMQPSPGSKLGGTGWPRLPR